MTRTISADVDQRGALAHILICHFDGNSAPGMISRPMLEACIDGMSDPDEFESACRDLRDACNMLLNE